MSSFSVGHIKQEFPKLRASRVFAPLCLPRLRAIRALLKCLTYTLCEPFSRALCALFVRIKIFLGWICSSAESSHFLRTIKGATNSTVSMWVKSRETF